MKNELNANIIKELNEKLIKWNVGKPYFVENNSKTDFLAGYAIIMDNQIHRLIGDDVDFRLTKTDNYEGFLAGYPAHEPVTFSIIESERETVYQWYFKKTRFDKQINNIITSLNIPELKYNGESVYSFMYKKLFNCEWGEDINKIMNGTDKEFKQVDKAIDEIELLEYEFSRRVIDKFGGEKRELLIRNSYYMKLKARKVKNESLLKSLNTPEGKYQSSRNEFKKAIENHSSLKSNSEIYNQNELKETCNKMNEEISSYLLKLTHNNKKQ